jgi:acetolactate synthase-1/2/3 large subunit
MRVGDRLAELLVDNGVDHVYGVPGGQTLPLYEGIRKFQGRIQHVLMRDERSAGYAADAHARMTGRVGVCDGTVGPGATNLVSPLAEAYCSSIPLIAIVSDIATSWEHRRTRGNASQAMDQMEMFQPVSKWQVKVTDPKSLDNIMDTAFRIATTGKPGPVVVCVPDDIATKEFDFRDRTSTTLGAIFPRSRSVPDPQETERAVQLIKGARKLCLVVGGGAHISGCYQQVRDLVELTQGAIVTTISGKGIIEETHPQAFGVTGSFGNPTARDVFKEADLVFFIGSKIGQLTTFTYRCPGRETPIIHLDADAEEIGRNYPESLPLVGDARLGLDAILAALKGVTLNTDWDFSACKQDHERWFTEITGRKPEVSQPLKPQAVMGIVNQVLTDEDLIVCDASLSSGWAASLLEFNSTGRRFIAPRGLAGLGWGAPATIGASLALEKRKRILHFAGDGGFGYSVQELEVMRRLGLPVVSVIFNNDTLGWIKHVQRDYYEENYISTDYSHIDYATVARGFGVRGYTAHTLDEFREFLELEESPEGPAVIEVISDQWESAVLPLQDVKIE